MDITLELIDAASGAVLATEQTSLDALPEAFEGVETHLSIGDVQYHVVGADPSTRELIAAAGRVRLLLTRVAETDPRAILFSVPTLENGSAPIDATRAADDAIKLHEDDWRQIELVQADQLAAVDEELQEISALKAVAHVGSGYSKLHVRRRVPTPLVGATVSLRELRDALDAPQRDLAIRGVGVVRDGFALPLGDAMVYGTAPDGVVTTLAVQGIADDVVPALHPIALRHKLLLVEWCIPRRLRAHEAGFVE